MHSNVWCDKNLYSTNGIIRTNKSHAENVALGYHIAISFVEVNHTIPTESDFAKFNARQSYLLYDI